MLEDKDFDADNSGRDSNHRPTSCDSGDNEIYNVCDIGATLCSVSVGV